jgi:hypothetical protein
MFVKVKVKAVKAKTHIGKLGWYNNGTSWAKSLIKN